MLENLWSGFARLLNTVTNGRKIDCAWLTHRSTSRGTTTLHRPTVNRSGMCKATPAIQIRCSRSTHALNLNFPLPLLLYQHHQILSDIGPHRQLPPAELRAAWRKKLLDLRDPEAPIEPKLLRTSEVRLSPGLVLHQDHHLRGVNAVILSLTLLLILPSNLSLHRNSYNRNRNIHKFNSSNLKLNSIEVLLPLSPGHHSLCTDPYPSRVNPNFPVVSLITPLGRCRYRNLTKRPHKTTSLRSSSICAVKIKTPLNKRNTKLRTTTTQNNSSNNHNMHPSHMLSQVEDRIMPNYLNSVPFLLTTIRMAPSNRLQPDRCTKRTVDLLLEKGSSNLTKVKEAEALTENSSSVLYNRVKLECQPDSKPIHRLLEMGTGPGEKERAR